MESDLMSEMLTYLYVEVCFTYPIQVSLDLKNLNPIFP